jgi:Subtilase family
MARKNNFLLGFGERLTAKVEVPSGGGDKNPPYAFSMARTRVETWLTASIASFDSLSADAAPNDEVVGVLTLHPRYVSKSDFPRELLEATGLRAVGSKIERVRPDQWGIEKHPEEAYTEALYVAGSRSRFREWQAQLPRWSETHKGADTLAHVERFGAFEAPAKLRGLTEDVDREGVLEVVLHNSGDQRIVESFATYVLQHGGEPLRKYRRDIRGLTFFPVRTSFARAEEIARYSFVRVARPMPALRPSSPFLVRSKPASPRATIPQTGPVDATVKAVVFDGGLPTLSRAALSRWVQYIEPAGIGPAVPELENHGLAVTSALLFGQADQAAPLETPLCSVDHVRVLDTATGGSGDVMGLDVLDRILNHLDANPTYEFINISLGPRLPIEDDDVTEWTAALDERFAAGRAVATVATGNDGDADPDLGLNRIQPPSDGVNVLSVGSATSAGSVWQRSIYSCIGPGRSPGFVKPDGLTFGGRMDEPFNVLDASLSLSGVQGTSVASPLALRASTSVKVQLGTSLSPLAIRALMVHRADPGSHNRGEVGWGRFEGDLERLITCDDDESLVVYQGALPVGEHLRALIPMPDFTMKGMVNLTASLVIAPEVDPEFPGAYTRSGFEVSFRPHSDKYMEYPDGKVSSHPKTRSFFSATNLYRPDESSMREAMYKWEPCLRHTEHLRASSLKEPCFDIYYHHRQGGRAVDLPQPIPYALIVSLKSPKNPELYNGTVRAYSNILVALRPRVRIRL